MENKYADSGILFVNKTQNDKAPAFKGDIELSAEVVKHLVDNLKGGKPAKLDLAGWNRTSSKGTQFISLKASKPYVREGAPANKPASKNPWE